MNKFRVICAWRQVLMSGDADAPPENTSHGICPDCLAEQEAELAKIRSIKK